jgi:fatty-acyl-CoA synthase
LEFSLPEVHDAIAAARPEREAVVFRERRLTHAQLAERSRRLANALLARGLRVHRERGELAGFESGQDHVALYLYNGPEYLEGMLGACRARAASINVNYRYVEEELFYLLDNCGARAVIYHAEFAPRIARLRAKLPKLELLIQVADDSGERLLPGAVDYEALLAESSAAAPPISPSPDDLYILYTGGTTGMPKGVLWRQADIFAAALGGRRNDGSEFASREELVAHANSFPPLEALIGPPLMHGAAQWVTFQMWVNGATVLFPSENKRLDPDEFWSLAERERVTNISIVGDAFARPLLDQLARKRYDLSALISIGSGGAPLSLANKREFLERFPQARIYDGMGSSEGGSQAINVSSAQTGPSVGKFQVSRGSVVLAEDLSRVLPASDSSLGWLAVTGRVPLGYLGDAAKTARTFPVIDGVRYSVPGDRARHVAGGGIELLGRDSVCINSGGEKIFAEEVEHALKLHPDVFDAVVAGRPSERWGEEVIAVVALRSGAVADRKALLAAAEAHIARYKLPKAFVFVPSIQRSPSGKADYRWAREQAARA